jgi:UDP-N-acetylmuramate--alanine ligase
MAQVAVQSARDGDVLLCMGAGTIGAVPGQVVALLQGGGA